MRGAWLPDQVRAAEEALRAGLPQGTLMQRAAAGLARRCAQLLTGATGGVYGSRVVLLVGSGDNGGDALYAGARLAGRGAAVDAVLLAGGRAHEGGLAALRAAGGRAVEPGGVRGGADLVLDGVVGIGGTGPLRPVASEALAAATRGGVPVVAVDVPSGVDAATGAVEGAAVQADVTVTFGCLKPGLVVGPGAVRSGVLEVVDIGLGPHLPEPALRVPDAADVASWWPVPGPDDDKYTRGVVGVATGSQTYPGAAVLSVGAALAGPAGMVRYAGRAAEAVRSRWPEAVVTDDPATAGRVQAWAVGSGLGTDDAAADAVRRLLGTDLPVLLDADALTVAAEHPGWLQGRSAPTLVTPHDREFARVAGEVGPDRVRAAAGAAERLGVTVLLKGDRTVVAAPGEVPVVNPTGTAALATAGSGDVLAGLAGSLLAAGLDPLRAAVAAAFVHGLAGRWAAERGPVSAGAVLAAVPDAVHAVLGGPTAAVLS